ncbi:MAG: FAD:protein FMN transferase [Microthrixaceae bacterium]
MLNGRDRWWTASFTAMGTTVDVLGHGGPPGADRVARALVERLESHWSRFRPDSDLSALNRDPAGTVEVGPALADALERAGRAHAATDGHFDPTVLDALEAAGYDRPFREVRDRPAVPADGGAPVPGFGSLRVEREDGRALVIRPPGVRVDLGGIGKGLAADRVVAELLRVGVRSAVASMGGDLRVGGSPPRGGWRVPVEDPWDDRSRLVEVVLTEGAVATSTTRMRRWPTDDGGWAHHLIDPTTGRPAASGLAAVVVVAAEAWWAEALAKAALVAGEEAGRALLLRHGATGWLVREDTEVVPVGAAPGVARPAPATT